METGGVEFYYVRYSFDIIVLNKTWKLWVHGKQFIGGELRSIEYSNRETVIILGGIRLAKGFAAMWTDFTNHF